MTRVVWIQHLCSTILGLFFINVGITHFTDPEWFEPIVPSILGKPRFWVLASGFFEVAIGICLIIPTTRRWTGLFLAGFLVILYWANLNMWINDIELNGTNFAMKWHILRALAQILMICIALWVGGWITFKSVEAEN